MATPARLDAWLAQLLDCRHLSELEMKVLCEHVRLLLLEESNIQPVAAPVTVCGDIHGQFWDLRELLRRGGMVPETSYVFMVCTPWIWTAQVAELSQQGDFVDRGYYSLETISLLLVLKARCAYVPLRSKLF